MSANQREFTDNAEDLFLAAENYEAAGDFVKAFNCLFDAAHLGHALSQISLGNFYSSGKGTKANKKAAARWYREAYRNGYRDGALNLAIDRKNEGRMKSAIIWFKKAIAMQDGEASVQLAKLYLANDRLQEQALDLLRTAKSMTSSNISEDTREEAESLLMQFS